MANNNSLSTSFGSLATYVYPGGYDQTKLGLGPLMVQANEPGNEGKWVGPIPVSVTRPAETSLLMSGFCPDAISWSPTYDWVILGDNNAPTATRRFELFRFNKTALFNPWGFVGAIICTIPFQGTQNTYQNIGHRVSYEKYTVGSGTITVSNGSTTVTGTGTLWLTNHVFAGCRIGFGSTDPTAITTWYEISAIGGEGSLTLTTNYLGTNASSQQYVIEDLRIFFVTYNAGTPANSGLCMVAGLRYELFTPVGGAVPAAVSTANVRAVYWISDGGATSNTNCQTYWGVAIDTRTDWTHQNVYALNSGVKIQVANFRATMSLASGRDSNSGSSMWQYNTGNQAVTGSLSTTIQNFVICTPGAGGGPRSGVKSAFFVTTTRFYGFPVSGITTGSTTFLTSTPAIEIPPGNSGNGSGATVTYTQVGGAIDAVTAAPVAGGSGYPLSSTIQLVVAGGKGGIVSATTNAGGVVSSFATTPVVGGSGYPGATGMATANCATFSATGYMASVDYDSVMDRFLVFIWAWQPSRNYVTQYREDGGQFDRVILLDTKQINQSTKDSTAAIYPINATGLTTAGCCLGGMTYLNASGGTATNNFLYNVPFGADWEYAATSNCRVVLPVMATTSFGSLTNAYFNTVGVIGGPTNCRCWNGGRSGTNLGQEPGAVRMYYRTTGISDNSGSWTLLDYSGDLSAASVASGTIQFMLEYRVCTNYGLPSRVTRVCVEGTPATTARKVSDPHFQYSVKNSDLAGQKYAWRYKAFGSTVSTLYIGIYDGVSGAFITGDDSVSQAAGTWEKCTDGFAALPTWAAFDTADVTNNTTYIRFTPSSPATGINVLPIISLGGLPSSSSSSSKSSRSSVSSSKSSQSSSKSSRSSSSSSKSSSSSSKSSSSSSSSKSSSSSSKSSRSSSSSSQSSSSSKSSSSSSYSSSSSSSSSKSSSSSSSSKSSSSSSKSSSSSSSSSKSSSSSSKSSSSSSKSSSSSSSSKSSSSSSKSSSSSSKSSSSSSKSSSSSSSSKSSSSSSSSSKSSSKSSSSSSLS